MFGVVPKPLWSRRTQPDDRNRIPLAMRCLLIEHDVGPILIDTGAGNKEDAKFHDIYAVDNHGTGGPTRLEDGLRAAGVAPEDVALVINTHLHFDHAGGNTVRGPDGEIHPAFPNARYVVQARELEFASNTNERTAGSYFPHNFRPIAERGQFDLVDGDREIADGIRVVATPGHVPHHQGVLVESAGERLFYFADLVPTVAHLPLAWIMGYDVAPLVTLETKRRILKQAVADDWVVMFEHDPATAWGRVVFDEKNYALSAVAPAVS